MKYPKYPKRFQKMQIYSPRFQCRLRNMMKLVRREFGDRKGISVIDAGCGTGTLMSVMEAMGYRPDGFDVSQKNVSDARKGTGGTVERGDIKSYKPKKRYDLVICGEVLEHIKDDTKAMKNLRRMLKEGGLLVISVPNDPNQWCLDDEIGGHVRRYTKGELERKLKSAGFRDFKSRYIGWPIVNRFMYGKRFREAKEGIQREPTFTKKAMLRLACFLERLDDLFNTPKADKIVMSCKAD